MCSFRTQLSSEVFKTRGVAHVVSIVRGPLAASMNALIVRCPSFFPSSFAYSVHAILLCSPNCTSVPPCTSVPNCTSLSATFLSQAGSCIMRRLGKTWTWAQLERCLAETSIYPAPRRTKEQEGNPKIYGYSSGLQWAIYKGS